MTLSDVRRLWSRLTPEQQRCIQLIGIQGLSYEETATIEQVPVGTIKSRVLRGGSCYANSWIKRTPVSISNRKLKSCQQIRSAKPSQR